MVGKSVILLINRFSANHTGINLSKEEFLQRLINTKILFLLANTISICQPLNQSIIKI